MKKTFKTSLFTKIIIIILAILPFISIQKSSLTPKEMEISQIQNFVNSKKEKIYKEIDYIETNSFDQYINNGTIGLLIYENDIKKYNFTYLEHITQLIAPKSSFEIQTFNNFSTLLRQSDYFYKKNINIISVFFENKWWNSEEENYIIDSFRKRIKKQKQVFVWANENDEYLFIEKIFLIVQSWNHKVKINHQKNIPTIIAPNLSIEKTNSNLEATALFLGVISKIAINIENVNVEKIISAIISGSKQLDFYEDKQINGKNPEIGFGYLNFKNSWNAFFDKNIYQKSEDDKFWYLELEINEKQNLSIGYFDYNIFPIKGISFLEMFILLISFKFQTIHEKINQKSLSIFIELEYKDFNWKPIDFLINLGNEYANKMSYKVINSGIYRLKIKKDSIFNFDNLIIHKNNQF